MSSATFPVGQWADLREVTEGEPCPRCGAALEFVQAIEVGHTFKLGRKFTTALGVTVTGPDGSTIGEKESVPVSDAVSRVRDLVAG